MCVQDYYCTILNYIGILADPQPSTSHSGPQSSLLGFDYVLHELERVELESDADLKGVLVGSLCVLNIICIVELFISNYYLLVFLFTNFI